MKLEKITAKRMRNLCDLANTETLVSILSKIETHAVVGETHVMIPNYKIEEDIKVELEKRGFVVNIKSSGIKFYSHIAW